MIFILALGLAIVGMFGLLLMMLLINMVSFIGFVTLTDPKNDSDRTYDSVLGVSNQTKAIIVFLFIPIGLLVLLRHRRIEAWKNYLDTL